MKFTKKAEYAVILAGYLTENTTVVSLSKIAKDSHISYSFLRQVGHMLAEAGIVKGEEGKAGGYTLSKSPDSITLRNILEAIGEPIVICPCCDGSQSCGDSAVCPRNSVLYSLQIAIDNTFGDLTIDKLIRGEKSCVKTWKKF